jgi:5-methyltetrahydrofolate--homocysteine methyltransferase
MSTIVSSTASSLYNAVTTGNAKQAENAAREALASGVSPQSLLTEELIPAMKKVEAQFQCHDCAQPELCYIPEQMLVNLAIQSALKVIRPALEEIAGNNGIRVVIGTVEGDRCELGRDLVAPLLRGIGCEVVDLGVGVANEELVRVASEKPGTILVLYTRKTSSVPAMKQIKEELLQSASYPTESGDETKILVVGHKITKALCEAIGADDFTDDAMQTIAKVSALAGIQ